MRRTCRAAPLLCALILACHGSSPGPLEARPGDSLFEHLELLAVARFPDSNLPADLRATAREAFGTRSQSVPPEAWKRFGEASERPGEPLWKTRTRVRLDLGLGRPWLTHDGRACGSFNLSPRRLATPTHVSGWRDPETGLTIGWSSREGGLVASSPERPREVRFGWELDDEHDGRGLEPLLLGGRLPADGRDLERDLELDKRSRRVLVVGTPSRLETSLALGGVDELRLSVARWDVGFEEHGGQLLRVPSPSDGLVFRVLVDGELVWSRAVTEANEFHEATIDLSPWQGRAVRLALETDPGPAGDARFDYGLWAGLSLHGEPRTPPAHPHIVLVDVDTLRADRLGCYGYGRPTSPRIDAWAARAAVVYDDFVAHACWTLPSTITMVTGLAPTQHGVFSGKNTMGAGLEPVAMRLRAAGYETHGRSDGAFVSASYGFGLGFDSFDCRPLGREELERHGWQAELERIRVRRSERPQFWFLQTYMVHGPYPIDRRFEDAARPYQGRFVERTPERLEVVDELESFDPADWRWMNDTYDAGVRRMDEVVGAFLEGLDEAFGGDPYLVIVTSDHGEELGDHGGLGHGHALHEELLRVPLLVRFPDGPRGTREVRPASSLDLVPTMLALAGIEVPAHLAGRALLGSIPDQRLRVAENAGTAFATYLDGWKRTSGTIDDYRGPPPFVRLSDLREDPLERVDRAAGEVERVHDMAARLEDYLARHPALGALAGEVSAGGGLLEELRRLGYTGDE